MNYQALGFAVKRFGKDNMACVKFYLINDQNQRRFRYVPLHELMPFVKFQDKSYREAIPKGWKGNHFSVLMEFKSDNDRRKFEEYLEVIFQTKSEIAMMNLKK